MNKTYTKDGYDYITVLQEDTPRKGWTEMRLNTGWVDTVATSRLTKGMTYRRKEMK